LATETRSIKRFSPASGFCGIFLEKGGGVVSSSAVPTEFVSVIAEEMALGVDAAVECWMAQIDRALQDTRLTTLGRMSAVQEVLASYKRLTGKTQLSCRRG
jgi:hypothetical protein